MPLYEYRGESCGAHFERLSSWSAADQQRCPVCGVATQWLVSAFASAAVCLPSGGG